MFLKYLCEFLGTMMLILLGDGVVANVTLNKSGMKGAGSIQITLAWGLAVMIPAFIFGEASGASFNPALTIALAAGGMFDWALVPGYVIAQILGGIVGGVLVYILFKDHFDATEDPGTKLGVFSTGPSIPKLFGIHGRAMAAESFTYIFTGKNAHDNEDKQINKLKTCLLMLEKDLYDKYNFKVLVSRPQGIFTKAYVVIRKECEKRVLDSQYGKYFSFVAPGRVREKQSNSSETVSDTGDVFFLDLKAVWEDHYPNLSFPQFKYWYFNKNSNSKDKVEIMPSICDEFSVRQKVSVETKGELLLCDIRAKILEDFEYIADTLYATFKRTYFTLEEFAKAISPKYGATKARIISNSIFHLVDPESKCVKYRAYDDRTKSQYTLSNGTFKEILNRSITRSQLIKNLDGNNNTSLSKFMPLSPEGKDATVLKLLSIFDYATYEVVGGEQPEIFIRLNDPEKIRRIVYGEIKYSNSYVTKAKQKHDREVKILRKFFTDPLNDEARWDYVERYFLGDDVLREVESIAEEKVDFSKFVDKEKSYHINNVDSWDKIAFLFDENIQPIIGDFAKLGVPLPNYLSTAVKRNLLDGEIVMSWPGKNVIVFAETISEKDDAICAKKGWHPFELFALEPEKLKEAIG